MDFAFYPLLRIVVLAVIGLLFGRYFARYFKKHGRLPRSWLPYILLGLTLTIWLTAAIRISPPQQMAKTVETFDAPTATVEPVIQTYDTTRYAPADNAEAIQSLRSIGTAKE